MRKDVGRKESNLALKQIDFTDENAPARQPRSNLTTEEDFLLITDFNDSDYSGERPEIMCHLIKVLTGVNIAPQTQNIVEEDRIIRLPTMGMYEALDEYKDSMPV